ncbi:LysR family transcriptional regulator [Variovorax paradoxus]|uniref:HTH-type transcriptional activator CmpR n=1 Tax=Variovorax paradoxus TaxID=34073 RepID=A0A0H2LUS8_VARPD|nr:LysR substrate-binding domain-containing protein [Variovorax paradoxus]KLN53949.1 HTH-type transcriptional activator CmpR [Variovorax paradoxus]
MAAPNPRILINLRQLEVLRAVMRYHTTIGAAEELGMSQPAVSNAIKLAEAKIGVQLFDRISNRLQPTADARVLLADAEPLFRVHEAVQRKAWDLRTGRAGVLRIAATAELSQFLVPQVLRRFLKDHPQVRISLETLRMDDLLESVESGGADLGVAMRPPVRSSMVVDVLVEAQMMCLCPPGDPLAAHPVLTPFELRNRTIIGPSPGSPLGTLIDAAFESASDHYAPDIEVRFSNVASVLVEQGLGVGFVDEITARYRLHSNCTTHRFRPRVPIKVCGLVVRDRPVSRMGHAFLEQARSFLQNGLDERTVTPPRAPPAAG